jgi:hypothetical protein
MTSGPAGLDPRLVRAVLVGIVLIGLAAGTALTMRPLFTSAAPGGGPPATEPPPQASSPRPPATEVSKADRPRKRKGDRGRQQVPKRQRPTPAPSPTATPVLPQPPVDPVLRPFTGLSTWIDIYDTDLTPAQQIQRAAAGGVQLIYVQSARHKSTSDLEDPVRLGQVIELAHDRNMLVMVWYVPDFVHAARDLRRSQAAIAFQSPRGDRPDAFGLDVEIEDEPDVAKRSRALLELSRRLREWTGPTYPMAAVVLPPLQLDLRPGWWPDFPWAELRPYYQAIIPMSYSSFRGTDKRTTYQWNVANVEQIRLLCGDPTVPIHIAGGIADNFPQVGTFVDAVHDVEALGGGLYDLSTTHPDAWPILAGLRATQPSQ